MDSRDLASQVGAMGRRPEVRREIPLSDVRDVHPASGGVTRIDQAPGYLLARVDAEDVRDVVYVTYANERWSCGCGWIQLERGELKPDDNPCEHVMAVKQAISGWWTTQVLLRKVD